MQSIFIWVYNINRQQFLIKTVLTLYNDNCTPLWVLEIISGELEHV